MTRAGRMSYYVRWRDPTKQRRQFRHLGYSPQWNRARAQREVALIMDEVRARQRASVEREAKRIGGSIADAYGLLRRCLQALDSAERQASGAPRLALRHAITECHGAEDQIGRALREM